MALSFITNLCCPDIKSWQWILLCIEKQMSELRLKTLSVSDIESKPQTHQLIRQ